MSRILITGANGFIGRNLCHFLCGRGHKVLACSRKRPFKEGEGPENCEWFPIVGDLDAAIKRCMESHRFHAVVHLAGRINGHPDELRNSNEAFLSCLLEQASLIESRFVFISSLSARQKLGPYGRSKRNCEELLANSKLENWIGLRPGLVYGPGDSKNVTYLINIIQKFPFIPVPSGKGVDYWPLYVNDLNSVIEQMIEGKGRTGHFYDIVGPECLTLMKMIQMLCKRMKRQRILVPFPIWPLQLGIEFLHVLFPWLKLPLQQIRGLQKQLLSDRDDLDKDFNFNALTFEEGLLSYQLESSAKPRH